MKIELTIIICIILTGCARVKLPSNVIQNNNLIDSMDFSYQPDQPKSFSQLKLCVAENISNDSVTLTDSSKSFIGPATGNYYKINQNTMIPSGDIFKYAEESTSTILAKGVTDAGSAALGATRDLIRYDLKAAVDGTNVTLKFSNILHALQDTGYSTNDGFETICVLSGCRPKNAVNALSGIANKIKECLK